MDNMSGSVRTSQKCPPEAMTTGTQTQTEPATSPASDIDLPFVSVVVPAYNERPTIAACIEALLAQDYPADRREIIIVDNNSNDGTPDIVGNYPVRLAFERETQTSYAARNRGIALAEGEIIAFLDADCIADKNWLENLTRPFDDPAVGVAGGRRASQEPDSGAGLVELFLAQTHIHDERLYHPSEPKGFPTANVAYRAVALDRVGVFDAAMPIGGDVDLAWRVQVYGGYLGIYVPDAVVYHKHHTTLSGHFGQFRGYGVDEMVLTTLYRKQAFHRRTPVYQLRLMARQMCALVTYGLSFVARSLSWRRWQSDRMYLAWPVLCFVTELANLVGKAQGLIKTRFFRRNPYPTNSRDVKRTTPGISPGLAMHSSTKETLSGIDSG